MDVYQVVRRHGHPQVRLFERGGADGGKRLLYRGHRDLFCAGRRQRGSFRVFYTVVIEICFVLVVVNAALFATALFGQRVYNFVRARSAWRANKLYVIVGLNKHNIELLASVGRDAGAVLVADGSKEARDAAYFVKRAAVALGRLQGGARRRIFCQEGGGRVG